MCTVGVDDYDETERRIIDAGGTSGAAEDGTDRVGLAGLLPRPSETETDAELTLRLGGHNLGLGPGIERILYATAPKLRFCQFGRNNKADRRSRGGEVLNVCLLARSPSFVTLLVRIDG